MNSTFRKVYNAIALDTELYGTALKLYIVLRAIADFKTREIVIYIDTLAKKINRSPNTVRRYLTKLINFGLVERITRKSPHNNKMNLANLFIVHDIDAKRYATSEEIAVFDSTSSQKMRVPTPKNGGQIIKEVLEKDLFKEITINREATKLPEKKEEELLKEQLKQVPEVLHSTARYILLQSGRKLLTANEIQYLRNLFEIHTPVRIQKEIDKTIERFRAKGKSMRCLTFDYIWAALKNQKSLKKKNTVQPAQPVEIVADTVAAVQPMPELKMSVEEAEKVIAEGVPEKKAEAPLSEEQIKFHEKLRAKVDEMNKKYFDSLEKDEDGCCIFSKTEDTEENSCEFSLLDYLRLRFPTEDETLLTKRSPSDEREMCDARDIDLACACCTDKDNCFLPKKFKIGGMRPFVSLETDPWGKKSLVLRYGGCIKCKRSKTPQKDPELENKIKQSGLTATQAEKTFATYDHKDASPEIVVAKAKAVMAAKNGTSLILAGKPGTGKTHLAIAIALEAMKNGRKAIFKNMPELLDEICRAYQDHTDPFGLMMKYKNVSCLVLDDWGKEKTSEARLDYLYQIIDYRYSNGLQTIATTNALTPEGLKNRWNADKIEPLVSRLLENGEWVTIQGAENYRLKKRAEPEPASKVEVLPENEVEPCPDEQEETTARESWHEAVESTEDEAGTYVDEYEQHYEQHEASQAEVKAEEEAAPKSWQEISESAEYKAMSEYDKIRAQWEFLRASPKYEALTFYDKAIVQREFCRRLNEASQDKVDVLPEHDSEQKGCVITVPHHDDGLDDEEDL